MEGRPINIFEVLRNKCIAAVEEIEAAPASTTAAGSAWAYMQMIHWIDTILPPDLRGW